MSGLDVSKSVKIEEIHQKSKAASMSAEAWIHSQADVRSTLEKQNETIGELSSRFRQMEQQVKAIARVMASQNVQRLSESMKLGLEDLKKDIMHTMQEKQKDLLAKVEKDVSTVVDSRAGMLKKLNDSEEKITRMVTTKLEDAARARHTLQQQFEDVKGYVVDLPQFIKDNTKLIDSTEQKISELKKQMKHIEVTMDAANAEQDKEFLQMTSEIRAAHESAKEKLEEDSKLLSKSVAKHEQIWEEKIKNIHDMMEKESAERQDMCKSISDRIIDKMHDDKLVLERSLHALDGELDRKVAPVLRNITDVKTMIQEERSMREASDQEIARQVAVERKQRDLDEERLLNMIHACTTTLSKMHKAA